MHTGNVTGRTLATTLAEVIETGIWRVWYDGLPFAAGKSGMRTVEVRDI
jgi:hypothetical protein